MAMLTSDQLRRDWQRQRQRQRQKEERHQQRVNSKGKGKGKGKSSISISSDDEGSSSNSDDDNNSDESSGADVSASRAAPKPSRPPPAAAAPAPKGGVQVEVLIDNTRWRPSGTALPYSSHQHHPRRSLPLPSAGSEPRKNKIMRKSTGGGAIRKHAAAIVATVSESSDEYVLGLLRPLCIRRILTLLGGCGDTGTATPCSSPCPRLELQPSANRELGQCRYLGERSKKIHEGRMQTDSPVPQVTCAAGQSRCSNVESILLRKNSALVSRT